MLWAASLSIAQSIRKGPLPDGVTINVRADAQAAVRDVSDGKSDIAQIGQGIWPALPDALKTLLRPYAAPGADSPAFAVNRTGFASGMPAGYGAALDRWSLIAADVKPKSTGSGGNLDISMISTEDAVALAAAASSDPAYFRAPLTGAYTPLRARWSNVKTAVEPGRNADGDSILIGKVPVPEDALVWNMEEQSWRKVGAGVSSFSTATYTYVWGTWHTGQPITIADIMYGIAFGQEQAAPGPGLEPALYKGFTLNKDGTLTAYFDSRSSDPNEVGALGAPYIFLNRGSTGTPVPWEVMEALKLVYSEKALPFSASGREQDLMEGIYAEDIRAKLEEMAASRFVPPSISRWMTPDAAAARCQAAADWIGEHGSAFISNGPFTVAAADAAGGKIELAAFRAAGYPFETAYWKKLVSGRTARIDEVSVASPAPRTKSTLVVVKATAISYPDGAESAPDAALKVRLSLAGVKKTYAGIRDKSGQYAITIPAADLKNLPAGTCGVVVEAFYTTEPPAVKNAEIVLQ
jgi:hypothetical protein